MMPIDNWWIWSGEASQEVIKMLWQLDLIDLIYDFGFQDEEGP